MSEIYFLCRESKEKSDHIKTLLNKIDLSKKNATIQNNETSKEVHPFLEGCTEELTV